MSGVGNRETAACVMFVEMRLARRFLLALKRKAEDSVAECEVTP